MSERPEDIEAVLAALPAEERLILPALQGIQERFGFVPAGAVAVVAQFLAVSRADVVGVLSFYRDLRTDPPAPVRVTLCAAEACQSVGARDLAAQARQRYAAAGHEAPGRVEVAPAYCLGNCAAGPAARINGRLLAHATPAALDDAVRAALRGAASPTAATAADRWPSPAAGEPGSGVVTVFVPGDSAARSLGADDVAAALLAAAESEGHAVRLVRNGSRGAIWLEPLVEVETHRGRIGYGPVAAEDVHGMVRAGMLSGADHAAARGPVDGLPWLADQHRVILRRNGIVDPASMDDFVAHGGLRGLRAAIDLGPDAVVAEVLASGLRGRGGAGFPAGVKWETVRAASGPQKYLCCNADEGDSGTFADRLVMEGDPFGLLEGMAIAALAVGASVGFAYVRSEYPEAVASLRRAVSTARAAGMLGPDVLGTGHAFDVHVRVGAGSYACGEETAMLESLEGRRGTVRARPPLPAHRGLFGRPTLVHNVLTLAAVPAILADGAETMHALGTGRSRGTQVVQLAGNVARGGAVEVPYGIPLRVLIEGFGGGTRSGRPVRCVQVGGPLGAYLPEASLDAPLDYEALAAVGGMLGHGGIVVFDDTVDMAEQARFAMQFCAEESCGTCTPCRIGSVRGVELMDRIRSAEDPAADLDLLDDLCDVMAGASLCALGGLTPDPVRSAIRHFPEDFGLVGGGQPGRTS